MSHVNPDCSRTLEPFVAPWLRGSVAGRFRLSGLLLAAWMTLIPSVGFAQNCLQWADRTPPLSPGLRAYHAMAYDSARGVTVLFGGYDWVSYYGDTWKFANPPFDDDCDGERDLFDFAAFQRCFSPGLPAEAECERFDPSGDEGVDLADFAGLRSELTGPMPPPVL